MRALAVTLIALNLMQTPPPTTGAGFGGPDRFFGELETPGEPTARPSPPTAVAETERVFYEAVSDALACRNADGLQHVWRFYDLASGAPTRVVRQCFGPRSPGPPSVGAAVPPPPPPRRVLEEAPLPPPAVHLSPPGRTPVGFEVWMWWGASPAVDDLTVSLDGWTARVSVRLAGGSFDMGDGTVTDTLDGTHVYQRAGSYTVSFTVRWEGTITLTRADSPGLEITQAIEGASFAASAPMEVYEVEAVLVE